VPCEGLTNPSSSESMSLAAARRSDKCHGLASGIFKEMPFIAPRTVPDTGKRHSGASAHRERLDFFLVDISSLSGAINIRGWMQRRPVLVPKAGRCS